MGSGCTVCVRGKDSEVLSYCSPCLIANVHEARRQLDPCYCSEYDGPHYHE